MNFVVFSYNFLPQSDAEAYCTARFCSALAATGNVVHVVTMDHPVQVSDDVLHELIDDRLVITRVPLKESGKKLLPRVRFMTPEWSSANYNEVIGILKEVLRRYDNPILVSRSMPESSHIIAYHVRKYVAQWVAHFSDPIPFMFGKQGFKGRIWGWLSRRWVKKVLKSCDYVSLTCEEAKFFYHETYGSLFDEKNAFVTPHIGDPPLAIRQQWRKPSPEKLIVHSGMLSKSRGSYSIVGALDKLNENGICARFVQVGPCDNDTRRILCGRCDSEIMEVKDPDLAAAIVASCDVSLIADVQVPMAYIPFMPSKFVYQLFSDKPLVLLTKKKSPMWRVASQYKSAGLFVADYTSPSTLALAIQKAVGASDKREVFVEREMIRREYEQNIVAKEFIRHLVADTVHDNA